VIVCVRLEALAPQVIVQPVDPKETDRIRELLLSTLYRITPEVGSAEDTGYVFLDAGGLQMRWPDRGVLLRAIDERVKDVVQTRPSLGVASTLFTSRLAADRAVPGSPRIVEDAAAFLASMPVSCLPLDDDQRDYFQLLGLRTLGELRHVSRLAFRRQFGVKALAIHDLAWGIDPRVVAPWRPPSRIEESTPLDPPLEDTQALQFVVRALTERVGERLAAGGLGAREIVIRLDQEGAARLRLSVRYAYPLTTGVDLFDRIRSRLKRIEPRSPLERVTLSVRHVEPAHVRQPGLLLRRDGLKETLADAIGRLQEEGRPELVLRVTLNPDAPPVADRRIRWAPMVSTI
jgi:DNA polymerase IV